jgi:mannitol/fructose-specific phosphotransferase system IIA component (Ntr-type)
MAIAEVFPLHDTTLDFLELRHRRRETALQQFVHAAADRGALRHGDVLLSLLLRRERLGSTALGRGFALTGAWSLCVRAPRVIVGVSERGLDWNAPDAQPVTLAACVLTPADASEEWHARRLAAVHAALRLQRTRQRITEKRDPALLAQLLHEATP